MPPVALKQLTLSFALFASPSFARESPCASYPVSGQAVIQSSASLIAHAAGEIDSKTYTNSLDALNLSYQRGFRVFELDLRRTSDGTIVAVHDWAGWHRMTGAKGTPDHREFMSLLLWQKYQALDLTAITVWMEDHPDALMIADIKEDRGNILNEIRAAILTPERWIPEVYTKEEIEHALDLGFPEPILMTDWNWPDHSTIKELVESYQIRWVGFPWPRFLVNRLQPWLAERGVKTLVHTVSSSKARQYWRSRGADIFYTEATDIEAGPGYRHVCEWLGARE